ncbi:unnamed protein product [Rotaria socialis]|uniref:B30.2/SPRY domain-containing protein n=1 Tax=Rotaria socialis TaxID=392032 RepID=A0A818ATI3_9BILA|nr:unnamed protein product [Rotaria socialis]CAF3411308.1 unnamed protein product [Rotaria socialis]CAF3588921.1 unnamed protein product [Rotaria socialis]CAF3714065.1 unnamed protein product [Rotaria socialis]CAF3756892.1 unnamed protein product [Rotaria socialis]
METKKPINQDMRDTVLLADSLKWKSNLILENDLRFDPSCCGVNLFISDENIHLKKITNTAAWRTCRAMNAGWSEGIHYWSIRINDRGPEGYVMIGIVTEKFDTSKAIYPGNTADSYGFYVYNGNKYNGGSSVAFISDLPKNNDVIGVLLDFDSRTLSYFKNGTILGTAFGLLPVNGSATKYYPAVGFYSLGQWVNFVHTAKF